MGLLSFLRSIFRVDQKPSPTRRAGDPILTSFGLSAVSVGEHEISLPPVRIDFSDEDDFETDVVGESFRQDDLAALAGRVDVDSRGRRTFVARLRPEPGNPYASHAVAVVTADTGDQLGYLARDLARELQSALLQRGPVEVPALLTGGTEGKVYGGVCLDLTELRRVLGLSQAVRKQRAKVSSVAHPAASSSAERSDLPYVVAVPPKLSTVLDGVAPFERADVYALTFANGRFHLLPYDAWLDPEAPARLSQKRPEEWSVDDFARRARVAVKMRRRAERHFLYNDLLHCLYKNRRSSSYARSLCEVLARQHIAEWPELELEVRQVLRADDSLWVPAFQILATLLTERGAYEDAIRICEKALKCGLDDGTKSGFPGRIKRIQSAARRSK